MGFKGCEKGTGVGGVEEGEDIGLVREVGVWGADGDRGAVGDTGAFAALNERPHVLHRSRDGSLTALQYRQTISVALMMFHIAI